MPVQTFTLEQFEESLPKHKVTGQPLCRCVGLIDGEYEFHMPVDTRTSITIRSSIGAGGYSADSGEDSIRAWLTDCTGIPLGSKVSRWTTRLPGWEVRLRDVLRTLWTWRKIASDCPRCKTPLHIFKVRKAGPNKGRIFSKCVACEADGKPNNFTWLDDA